MKHIKEKYLIQMLKDVYLLWDHMVLENLFLYNHYLKVIKTEEPRKQQMEKTAEEKPVEVRENTEPMESAGSPEIGFMGETAEEGQNNNEKILEMHRQGKSTVAIAKELGLGVGEVKLVIDLYKA